MPESAPTVKTKFLRCYKTWEGARGRKELI
jgi:hypothetical protein